MAAATLTHCPYCSLQCGISVVAGDRPATLEPQPDFPTNRGGLCSKGWNAAGLLDHPQRLLSPLVRSVPGDRTSPFRAAGWDEALDLVAGHLVRLQAEHGRDAVGCFGGGGLTNEKAYTFGKFARVALGTAMIDYNGRFCMSSAATASNRAFGLDRGLPFPLADLAEAQTVVLVGANPAATMPPAMQFLDAGRAAGATHVVVDPRATATAQGAALHLASLPGTDLALANGLLHLAVKEGLVDEAYVAERTTGFDAVRAGVASSWPDRVERITGVPVESMRQTLHALAGVDRAVILTARGAEQHSSGTDTAQAWVNLALALGLPGRPFSGYGTITGQGNGQGGREHGQKADQLPGYRKLADPADRAHVAAVWGVDPASLPQPGLSAFEMLDRLGTPGGVRALLVLASNLVVSAPDVNRVRDRLAALDLLVVSDIFLSETAALADVVLPTAQWAEEEGTMTNLEGRVIRRRQALRPPEGVHDDLHLMKGLAERLGRGQHFSTDPRAVFDELRRASAGGPADYSGITYERVDAEQGVFWPCPATAEGEPPHPGTPRLFADRFATPDGRARFVRVEHRGPDETPDAAYPHVLTTGRLQAHYQSGTQTRRHPAPAQSAVGPEVQLHPDLARALGIGTADVVRLTTRRGAATFRASLSADIRPDVVFVPFHWGGASAANALTNPALDPLSRMPAFKVCAVRAERVGAPDDDHLLSGPPLTADAATGSTAPTTRTAPDRRPPPRRREDPPMISQNRFLQGIFPFEGAGLDKPVPISPELSHVVPDGVVGQALYFRGGNSSDELVTVVLMRDGVPMRYFPMGAKESVHVPLRVVEDVEGGSVVELRLVAPLGVSGTVVVDLGLVEH
ncbi:molybdopterin oxidoreductase family protein [Microlunatus capsulatus]|uniref:Assimilatory nitrate reductase catalytic subunit n=1 Tax=Microlunatus capsulatus TaxID=99117 RepID=A0ABS4Z3G6_9ACTN|nr:molybdopterin oxidoreductase family protein [Microlunatus capsulatus]MBP2415534.1 assimilatory nitrate reductase catalytic subunit [Microlunatus capsulatus]